MPAGVLLASVCDSGWRPRDSLPTGRHQPCLQSQSQQQNLCVASPQNKADRPGGAGATGNRSCYPKGDKLIQGPKAQDRCQMGGQTPGRRRWTPERVIHSLCRHQRSTLGGTGLVDPGGSSRP